MHIPRESEAIATRMAEIENQLEIIEAALTRELGRPYMSRSREVCNFLVLERHVFAARLNELKWMLYE